VPLYEGLEHGGSEGVGQSAVCLRLVILVVMGCTAAITGDHVGLFLDFSPRRKILGKNYIFNCCLFFQNQCFKTSVAAKTAVFLQGCLIHSVLFITIKKLKVTG
jgi:hypothetical protein